MVGDRHRADVPADAGHQQPRAVRAQLRPPVRASTWSWPACCWLVIGWVVVRLRVAAAARQVRQPAAGQAGGHLRAGGLRAGPADLRGVLPVRLALDRELVRRQGRRRARRRPEPGPRHARHAGQRPGEQDARRRRRSWPRRPTPRPAWRSSASATSWRPTTWSCGAATGQLIASAGQSRFQLNPERPTPQQLRNGARAARRWP